MGPQATIVELPTATELIVRSSWSEIGLDASALAIAQTMPAGNWGDPVYHGTVYGVGLDNPFEPYSVTELQASRSVLVMFEDVSDFQVRYAIGACCTTGRNFLLGGCAACSVANLVLITSPDMGTESTCSSRVSRLEDHAPALRELRGRPQLSRSGAHV